MDVLHAVATVVAGLAVVGAYAGFVESRACSVAGRLPWASGDFNEARPACQRAGIQKVGFIIEPPPNL